MVDEGLEHYVGLSIRKVIEDAALVDIVQVQGHRDPVETSVEEWLAFDLIQIRRNRTRPNVWIGTVTFQVTCFSRMAGQRTDKQTNAPWILAGQVRSLFEDPESKRGLLVKAYGTSGEATVAVLKVNEADMDYSAPGDGASGTHYVKATFTGHMESV